MAEILHKTVGASGVPMEFAARLHRAGARR